MKKLKITDHGRFVSGKKNQNFLLFTFYCSLFTIFIGCVTPRGVFYKGFDPQKIKTLAVGDFIAYGNFPTSGAMVKDLMIQNLLSRGYTVKEKDSPEVEYILVGSITKFSPEKKYLVYTGDDKQQVLISGPMTEISGSNLYNIGSAFGIPNGNIVVSNATIGISARLVEKSTGNIVWGSSFSYEALSIETAASTTVNYLITSLTGLKQ